MKAYYYDDQPGDCRLAHESQEPLDLPHLQELGLHYYSLPLDEPKPPSQPHPSAAGLDAITRERGYSHSDVITVSPSAMGEIYESKIQSFFHEHMHEDEEIRYILQGAGYFDVRERGDDRWVRIRLEAGDLLVLPAGVYHRFTVDTDNYIKAMRLFKEAPKWTPLNRGQETEENSFRKEYIKQRESGFRDGVKA